jgi:hypothetical protein
MALTPLLGGRIRFTEARMGRAELKVPRSADGTWALPADLRDALRWEVAFEDLFVAQLVLTLRSPETGRTDQFGAETVQIESRSLLGPWRVEGIAGEVPFRLVTGELGDGPTVPVKLTGGGDPFPRFDLDAQVALVATPGTPPVTGVAKVLLGPPAQGTSAGPPIPVAVQAGFKGSGEAVELDPVAIEPGRGADRCGSPGPGGSRSRPVRLALDLTGRRLDLDRLLATLEAQDLRTRAARIPLAVPVDLDLSLNGVAVADEELTDLKLKVSLENDRARVRDLRFTAPGEARVVAGGEVGLAADGSASGRVSVTAADPSRLGRSLAKLRGVAPLTSFLDRGPLEAAADIAVGPRRPRSTTSGCGSATPSSPARPATSRREREDAGGWKRRSTRKESTSPACRPGEACSTRPAASTSASTSTPEGSATATGREPGASRPGSSRRGRRSSWARSTSPTSRAPTAASTAASPPTGRGGSRAG